MAERTPPADALCRTNRRGRSDADLLAELLDGGVWVVPPTAAAGAPRVATLLQPGGDAVTVLMPAGGRAHPRGCPALGAYAGLHAAHASELAATLAAIRRAVHRARLLAWLPRLALLAALSGLLGSAGATSLAWLGVPEALLMRLADVPGWSVLAGGAGLAVVALLPHLLAQIRLRRRQRARQRLAEAAWRADHGLASGAGADTLPRRCGGAETMGR